MIHYHISYAVSNCTLSIWHYSDIGGYISFQGKMYWNIQPIIGYLSRLFRKEKINPAIPKVIA